MCGKVAKIIYSVLKTGSPYDPRMHAAACGISWSDSFSEKPKSIETESFEEEAKLLAGITDPDDNNVEIDDE
jgi:hypothetical protein